MVSPTGRVPLNPSPTAWRDAAARSARQAVRTASRFPAAHFALAVGRTGLFLGRSLTKGQVAGAVKVEGAREPRLSAALTAQVAMDELILAIMNNPSRVPETSDLSRVRAEVEGAQALYADRGWLAHEANRTAYAWVLRHREVENRPWLVCLHGFGTGRAFMDFYAFRAAFLHHVLGLNVAIPVHPMHGERSTSRFSGADFMSHDLMNVVHGMAQSTWDTRRLVSWIRTQSPSAVGLYGVSLGGYLTALTAGLEDDLDCAIAGIPISSLPELFHHHAPPRLKRHPDAQALLGEQVADVLSVVSPLSFAPRVPLDRRFMFAGLIDRMATPEQAIALWEHWERPQIEWYGGNHIGYLWSNRVDAFVREALVESGLASSDAA